MATLMADTEAAEAPAAVAAPMAYLTPETATLLVLEIVAEVTATICVDTDTLLDAATEKDAVLTTPAEALAALAAETENAPKQMRLASTATVLAAANVAAPRLTP
jgi:hypothetical protein